MRTAWAGRGGGGSGRLKDDNGLAVDATEYTGEDGTGGSCEGVGEAERVPVGEAMVRLWCVISSRGRDGRDFS